MKHSIGGYFGLEISQKASSYPFENLIHLNSGRNCLEYILKLRKYDLLYIPYFTCDVLLEPLEKLGIKYQFYDLDNHLEPIFDYAIIGETQGFLYTNYFGIQDKFILKIAAKISNLIIDNAQSLFSAPLENIDTFYSPRKFVGVADGGFLSANEMLNESFEQDISYDRMSHLLKRIDLTPEEGYADFRLNDASLKNQSIKKMSKLTGELLKNLDYDNIKKIRRENFEILHEFLGFTNLLNIEISEDVIPMVYPYRSLQISLKKDLLSKKIFCATYWPNVLKWAENSSTSYKLTEEIIALPIDQRYSRVEMEKIARYV